MRRIFVIINLFCATLAFAWVPPRDPSKPFCFPEKQLQDSARHTMAFKVAQSTAIPTREIPKILVIMTNFSDYELVSSKDVVDSMFNGQDWTTDNAKGSVRQYFYDQSNGNYNPEFDIVGPVTLSKGYAYYGANSGANNSSKAGYMITEACALVDDSVNFADYDLNGDGNVDLVYILFAGFGENDPPETDIIPNGENLVWPHYWNIDKAGYGSNNRTFDGVNIKDYECSNELDGYYSTSSTNVVAGIGVMCHEFGHALGLPDWYTTNNSATHKTLGTWSVMDYGCYNDDMHSPPSYTAYEKYLLNWAAPDTLIYDTDNTNYYLIEYRNRSGWDRGTPGKGWMLTYIRPNLKSNNTKTNMAYSIIEADGLAPTFGNAGFYGKQGDLFNTRNEALLFLGCDTTNVPVTPTVLDYSEREDCPQTSMVMLPNGELYIITNYGTYSVVGIKK